MSGSKQHNWLDRIFIILSFSALLFLAYIGGIAAYRYNFFPAALVMESLEGGEMWWSQEKNKKKNAAGEKAKLKEQKQAKRNASKDKENKRKEPRNEKVAAFELLKWDKKKALNGYNLIGFKAKYAELYDMEGKPVYRWNIPYDDILKGTRINHRRIYQIDSHLYPNGNLLINFSREAMTPYGFGIALIDKNSKLLWSYSGATHHEFYTNSDHIYALEHKFTYPPIYSFTNLRKRVLEDFITILTHEGKVIKKISVLKAFEGTKYASFIKRNYWDLLHSNSVSVLEPEIADQFPMFKAGDMLVSIRNLNMVVVICHETEKVVWAAKNVSIHQHSAHFSSNGTIILFDNKSKINGTITSRILSIDPKTLGIVWSHIGKPDQSIHTKSRGRLQLLENKNILATIPAKRVLYEVTADEENVWTLELKTLASKAITVHYGKRYTPEEVPFLQSVLPASR